MILTLNLTLTLTLTLLMFVVSCQEALPKAAFEKLPKWEEVEKLSKSEEAVARETVARILSGALVKDVCSSVLRKLAGLADPAHRRVLEQASTLEKEVEDKHRLLEQVSALEKQVEEHERLWKAAEDLGGRREATASGVEAQSRREKAALFVHAITHGGVRGCLATAAGKAQVVAVQQAWAAACKQLEDENDALKRQLNASLLQTAVLESELEAASKRKQLEDDNASIRAQLEDDNASKRKQLEDDNGALKSQLEASVSQIEELEAQMGAMADAETHLASALAESVAEVKGEG